MSIKLKASARQDLGKGASRRLRLTEKVPAVVYGASAPQSITLEHKDLWKAQESESFYSSIFKLDIDGKIVDVIIKDLQRHPAKNLVLHADFLSLDPNAAITVNVPIHFINQTTCVGVKTQGGNIQFLSKLINVTCLPKDLPEFIEYDLIDNEAGSTVHISDIKLPKDITSVELARGSNYDQPLAQITITKG